MGRCLEELLGSGAPQSFFDIALPPNLRAAVLAPHPDDFDAIAVTLRHLLNNGNPVEAGVVPTGSGVEDCYAPGATLADKAHLRLAEQRRSLQFFGLPPSCLTVLNMQRDDEDDQPVDSPENERCMQDFLTASQPDFVFLPHGHDTNAGHRHMYAMFNRVSRRQGSATMAFLIKDPKTIAMRVNVYTPFGPEDAAWKSEMLRFHDSQHQRNLNTRGHGFDERILRVNRRIAEELSLPSEYAEAFELSVWSLE